MHNSKIENVRGIPTKDKITERQVYIFQNNLFKSSFDANALF